jgi:hypothetical protein
LEAEVGRGTGYIPDRPDERDLSLKMVRRRLRRRGKLRGRTLPTSATTADLMSPVRDQGDLGACTAFSVGVGLMESLAVEYRRAWPPLSPMFLYYVTRARRRRTQKDSGASLRDAMKAASKIGTCAEGNWPYRADDFARRPGRTAYQEAQSWRVERYYRVRDLEELKLALACRNPCVLGIMLYSSFDTRSTRRDGVIPMPNERREDFLGGHAVTAVGYDDNGHGNGHVVIRNSWGSRWGDSGHCYLPYDYFDPDLSLAVDMWTGTA